MAVPRPGLSDSANSLPMSKEKPWIELVFHKRECFKYIPSARDPTRCGCGRTLQSHCIPRDELSRLRSDEIWNVQDHTKELPTDAYGTIEFQGGAHPTKAQYVRLSHTTSPSLILQLLQQTWDLELPKLLISIHGGIRNFELQPKLKRVFRKGLLKAAKTTGAWIISGGTNSGVMRHVGDALGDTLLQSKNNIVTIGIAPWGVIHNRTELIGQDTVTPYHAVASPKSQNVVLNSNHSYFLLVDNGTVRKFGCEVALRKKLEKLISQQKITTRGSSKSYNTPVVCLVLEGGANTIRTVLECVTDNPPVPVVVCDGSGRAADLIAFTHKYAQDDGTMQEMLRDQLILTIEKTFNYTREQAEKVFIELMLCVKKQELITVFRMGEDNQDIDLAILTALLKSQNASAPDQLSLALTWNRPDIARTQIFKYGQEWPEGSLDQAMMDALIYDRVDFIKLLLENGVCMRKWLTMGRLEELYNIGLKSGPQKSSAVYVASNQKQDRASTLRFLIREGKKHIPTNYWYTLQDIGMVIEKLMGGAFRAFYCRRHFKTKYNTLMRKGHNISNLVTEVPLLNPLPIEDGFKYPFSELMLWAVLLRRQAMAKFMWQQGEEALAKALVSCKLYKSMAHEAEQDDLEIDVAEEIKEYAREFAMLAVDLLEVCYKADDDITQQLLTYKLQNWSDQTCLSLAVAACHRDFLAHTSCQILLTDMWMGGLRMRRYTSLKVILGIIFFPSFFFLEFKSKEELQLMPQTMEEHIQSQEDSDSDSNSSSSSVDGDHVRESESRELGREIHEVDEPVIKGISANGQVLMTLRGHPSMTEHRKNSPLRVGRKIYEFYTAPITKFWANAIGFLVFLMIYTYVVLVKMAASPSIQEYYIIAYVLTLIIEKLREILVSEPKKFSQKLKVHFEDFWNISDTLAIVLFVAGVVLRLIPAKSGYGKVLYCVSIIFWYVRIMDLFAVSKYLGPYVMMIGKMMKDMLSFIVILLIVLIAFGVVRQSITFPNMPPSWGLARDVFLKPYFMIYGEVYADEIDPQCSDDEDSEFKCVPGRFIVPTVMSIYLIVANILLINLLIAVFNNTFHQVNAISNQVWKFQRYSLVIEYESRPILPPPFTIVCHFYLLGKYLQRRCRGKGEANYFDCGLKLFLDQDEVERLHDFEEECMEDYFRERNQCFQSSTTERIRETSEQVENLSLRLDDINQKENTVKLSLQTVDHRMSNLEEITLRTAEMLFSMQQQLCLIQSQLTQQDLGSRVAAQEASKDIAPAAPDSSAPATAFSAQPSQWERNILSSSFPPTRKKVSEERLRPFTDYKKQQRPLFARAFSVGAPGSMAREISFLEEYGTSVTFSDRSGLKKRPPRVIPYLGSELYQRRYRRTRHSSTSEEDDTDPKTPKKHRPSDLKVKFKVKTPQTAPVLPSRLETIADVTARSAEVYPTSPAQYTQAVGSLLGELVLERPETEAAAVAHANNLHTSLAPSALPKNVMPITPIVTPTRMEYTSITDDIDTTCVTYRSPPGSPTTPRSMYFGVDANLDLYTQKIRSSTKGSGKGKQKPSTEESVQQLLNTAEESVRAQMENIIRKRIRQISLTENDELGELAKHVAQDMESSDTEAQSQPSYYSDDDELLSHQGDDKPTGMKLVKSEPALKMLMTEPSRSGGGIRFKESPPVREDGGGGHSPRQRTKSRLQKSRHNSEQIF